jgi:hypothetical protein
MGRPPVDARGKVKRHRARPYRRGWLPGKRTSVLRLRAAGRLAPAATLCPVGRRRTENENARLYASPSPVGTKPAGTRSATVEAGEETPCEKLTPISTFVADHPDAVQLLADLDLKLLNICVAHDNAVWRRNEAEPYEKLAREHPDRFAWCTSFDVPGRTTFAGPPTTPSGSLLEWSGTSPTAAQLPARCGKTWDGGKEAGRCLCFRGRPAVPADI